MGGTWIGALEVDLIESIPGYEHSRHRSRKNFRSQIVFGVTKLQLSQTGGNAILEYIYIYIYSSSYSFQTDIVCLKYKQAQGKNICAYVKSNCEERGWKYEEKENLVVVTAGRCCAACLFTVLFRVRQLEEMMGRSEQRTFDFDFLLVFFFVFFFFAFCLILIFVSSDLLLFLI